MRENGSLPPGQREIETFRPTASRFERALRKHLDSQV